MIVAATIAEVVTIAAAFPEAVFLVEGSPAAGSAVVSLVAAFPAAVFQEAGSQEAAFLEAGSRVVATRVAAVLIPAK